MNVTAVVLARDEAAFIGACLQSLAAVTADVLVLDACSQDATPEIARAHGARVVQQKWIGFAAARNAALALAQASDWVLFVDADERMPPPLAREIRALACRPPEAVDGCWIARRNVICGRIMRGGGWWPDYQLRLLRPARCAYPEDRAVHESAICSGPTLALNCPLLHLNYRSWSEFAAKQAAFARLAAMTAPAPRRRAYIGAPGRSFLRRIVSERGYLDGTHGLAAAALLSASEVYGVWLARRSQA